MNDPRGARDFAALAHRDQRYGADRPYTDHLDEVAAAVVAHAGDDPLLLAVAYLHDVLEDTAVTHAELEARFDAAVARAVLLVTDPAGPNRRARKALLHRRLADLDPHADLAARAALVVKAADRLANLAACVASGDPRLALYRREHPEFRAAAFRPGLCDPLWIELERLLAPDIA